ncbi:Uncaracterized surface protein containing fasciclin (FAS1) repeats [Filimonas lacunae]|uniref:Uncaracterized surface protein containing fasciclin (FAS1) repeats n=1 Tax=Filimonas lacunae TaxID=477680 RepID=A0A1N7R940_9BACT|nr:fasciclin domain-containing protein [Filimonas lacunae]SIT31660.1 Uncaracterized surface protein containing fasciclin (FAS1) repeats [Filimonas lacunae]
MKAIANIIKVALLLVAVIGWFSCKKINIVTTTTEDVNLVGYMERYPDTYSNFLKVLDKAQTTSYLNAYGAYTLFAPNNAAVDAYMKTLGKTSASDLTEEEAKKLVKYHLLEDTIPSTSFTDGKLPVPTMYGEYLVMGVVNTDGVSKYVVNRTSVVLTPDTRVANGILHTVDHMLVPSTKSLAQLLEENSDYSIFTQALKATGYYDTLSSLKYINDTTPRWLSVMAQKNAVFQAAGISSFDALKAKYSNTGNPLLASDSLHLYMAYHILDGLKYVADLVSSPSHNTLAPQEVLLITLRGDTVRINEETMAGVFEKGIDVNRTTSDVSATNGVLNDLAGNIYIKVRYPTPVYWDLADQPEIRKLTSVFRKTGASQDFNVGDLADVTWDEATIKYVCSASDGKNCYYYNDLFSIPSLRTSSASKTINWIQFKSPIIIKGKYKVWICWRSGGGTATKPGGGYLTQTYIDGVLMPRLVTFGDYRYGQNLTDDEIHAQGWKRYSATAAFNNNVMCSKLIGTIDITNTGRHIVKFVPTGDAAGAVTIDMIHFIPENMNQYSPTFAIDGTMVY